MAVTSFLTYSAVELRITLSAWFEHGAIRDGLVNLKEACNTVRTQQSAVRELQQFGCNGTEIMFTITLMRAFQRSDKGDLASLFVYREFLPLLASKQEVHTS